MSIQPLTSQKSKLIAVLLGVVTLILLVSTAPEIGLTWDEPDYIAAARSYSAWFGELFRNPREAFSQEVIDPYWAVNHEHPPMDKIWSGLVWSGARHLFDDLVAHRLGNMILVAVMVAILFFWIEKTYGWIAGAGAVAALLAMPRFFFHAHLAALDIPAAFVVLLSTFCFVHRADDRSWIWTPVLGLVFAIAYATKVNAVFVPPILLLWTLIFRNRDYLLSRVVLAFFLSIPISLYLWPWLYPDRLARFEEYIRFITIDHWEIGQWYKGQFFMPPPWEFTFVILWAVVPLTITLLYVLGIVKSIWQRKSDGDVGILLIINALVPMLALAFTGSMVYDNDRLFMPTFPFLAALAGIGLNWLISALWRIPILKSKFLRPALAALLSLMIFLPPLVSTIDLYPHLLSYYSRSVGGLQGATRLGLETTYWCETYAEALPYLNEHAQPGDMVWVMPWSHNVLLYYQMEGKLRSDLRIAAPQYGQSLFESVKTLRPNTPFYVSDWIIFQHRQTYFGGRTESRWITPEWLETHQPEYEILYDGIPLMGIYRNQ